MIFPANEGTLAQAATLLQAGDLVIFPTETVYGVGADARSQQACEKIFQAKGRPANNPLIVHVASFAEVRALVSPDADPRITEQLQKLSSLWPGPLTVVVPKSPIIAGAATAGGSSVGIRIPRHPVAQALLQRAGIPIAAPSANRSDRVSPTTAQHAESELGGQVSMILDGGPCSVGIESTVLSLVDPTRPTILRPGTITKEQLEALLSESVSFAATTPQKRELLSPGQLPVHYAPNTKLAFLDEVDLDMLAGLRVGYIAFSEGKHLDFDFQSVICLSSTANLSQIAAGLYEALREMDERDLDIILVDRCIETGIGKAIMDRLSRATAPTRKRP